MKKTIKLKTLSIFSSILILLGCAKEDVNPNAQNQEVKKYKGANISNKSTLNEMSQSFQYLGQVHNDGLDAVAEISDFPDHTASEHQSAIEDFYEEEWPSVNFPSWSDPEPDFDYTIESYFDDNTSMGATALAYAEDIDDILVDCLSDTLYDSTDIFDNFITLENAIYNSGVESEYKRQLIVVCVLARHSMVYWYNAQNDIDHPWHNSGTGLTPGNANVASLYDDAMSGSSGGGTFVPRLGRRFLWDLLKLVEYGEDCDQWPSQNDCWRSVIRSAGIASSRLSS